MATIKSSLSTLQRYDRPTIWLHWLSAGLVIGLWCLGQTIDGFPRGAPRIFARSLHISMGAILGAMLLYRIWWRLTSGVHLPVPGTQTARAMAKSVHWGLYVCLLVTVALGIANTWVRGDNLFYLYKLPAFDPASKALRATVEDWHAFAANLLLLLAGLHAAAGLAHRYLLKDDVLARMLPEKRNR